MNWKIFPTARRALKMGLLDEIMEEPDEKKAANTARLYHYERFWRFAGFGDVEKLREIYRRYHKE